MNPSLLHKIIYDDIVICMSFYSINRKGSRDCCCCCCYYVHCRRGNRICWTQHCPDYSHRRRENMEQSWPRILLSLCCCQHCSKFQHRLLAPKTTVMKSNDFNYYDIIRTWLRTETDDLSFFFNFMISRSASQTIRQVSPK